MSENSPTTENPQIVRLVMAGVTAVDDFIIDYMKKPDDLGEFREDMDIPDGYKKCGGCKHVLKLYMFNVNNASKNKCTGNCKACQKKSASKSYEKTKGSRDYKAYYAEHREQKQEHGRKYYQDNKQNILAKQKAYHGSSKGKKVMRKSHAKRRKLMLNNRGIPYKREYVIDRDKMDGEFPVCYICKQPIKFEREIHLDHVVAVVLGGKDCFTNVACTHEICNLTKTKDCREVSVEHVETIIERSEKYIDAHPELFEAATTELPADLKE